jgi:hypothetical protein
VETAKSCSVRIDASAPVTHAAGISDEWSGSDVSVTFTADDVSAHSTEYSIDGGSWI